MCIRDRISDALANQILGIVGPDISSVGEAADPHQITEGPGQCVDQHLPHKAGAKLRDAQWAPWASRSLAHALCGRC